MRKKNISNKSLTDTERLGKMKDAVIDLFDIPEVSPRRFAQAILRKGLNLLPPKVQVTLNVLASPFSAAWR